ncbi:4-(cytidine 5'-diphospho)-2-C-methyl-D-erythritol kinase [bacterium]|nr:4-(cytidine 5'-diphospho)-2-C-methyl-D-erythritol kinase [bacterium]
MYKLLSRAKINLFLRIGDINPDNNLHNLLSLMIPISLHDTLTITPSDDFFVSVNGIKEKIPSHLNILAKTHRLMSEKCGEIPSFTITIDKQIPTGGGLGGGSGNAAAYLRFLNNQLVDPLSEKELLSVAHAIGSDVPFFLADSPALISGTGEKIEKLSLTALPQYLILLIPDLAISTADAYHLLDKKRLTSRGDLTINTDRVEEICSLELWKRLIENDFQPVLMDTFPVFGQLMDNALRVGACCSFVTGSGSTVVAMFSDADCRDRAVTDLHNLNVQTLKTNLLF